MSEHIEKPVPRLDRQLKLITRTGLVFFAVWMALLVGVAVAQPDPFVHSWRLVLGQLVAGRAFSVSEGVELGFPRLFLLLQIALQDLIILLLLYQLLIAGYRRVEKFRVIGRAIRSIRVSAEQHKKYVEPFGALGLMVFVVFPFWSTGALAGGVVGYMLGIRTWLVFLSIIIGNFLSVGCWILFFQSLSAFMERTGAQLPVSPPLAVLITVIAIAVGYRAWVWYRGSKEPTPTE